MGVGLGLASLAQAQPPHDACVDAEVVPSLPFVDVIDTSAATSERDDPTLCSFGDEATVWYRYRPPSSATLCLRTSHSDYPTVVAPFTDLCGRFPLATCYINPLDSSVDFFADARLSVTAGRTVRLLVAGVRGSGGGTLRLQLAEVGRDHDRDGAADCVDNCPFTPNRRQQDTNRDGVGDACDGDGDGVPFVIDNCPQLPNPDQLDSDLDGLGDACDACEGSNVDDRDADGVPDGCDNCVLIPNADQEDADNDGIGDACECGDLDGDGIVNTTDVRLGQRCAIGQIPCPALCDADGNGVCNTTDARLVHRVAVGRLPKSILRCAARP